MSAPSILSARVVEHEPAGQAVFRLRLQAPEVAEAARPGQFVMLRTAPGPDPLLARPFSIHGAEGGELTLLYRVVGRGTTLLSRAIPGAALTLWGPLGRPFDLDPARPILVAGGMGVAPLAFAAARLKAAGRGFGALYGAASSGELVGGRLASDGRTYRIAGVDWSWTAERPTEGDPPDRTGLVTVPLAAGLASGDAVLACGPLPMLKAVAALCRERGAACQVSLEAPMACGVGACLGCAVPAAGGGYLKACQEGPVMDADLVDWGRL